MKKMKKLLKKIKNKKHGFLIAGALLLLIGLVSWAVYSVPEMPKPAAPGQHVMKYGGNTLSEEKNGVKIWEITAESMEMDVDTQNVTIKKLKGTFYQADGRKAEVTAPQGFYEAKTKNIKLEGGIKVETSDGSHLTSDQLNWNFSEAVLAAIGNAKVVNGDMEATGNRIESSDGFNVFKVIGKAHIIKGKAK